MELDSDFWSDIEADEEEEIDEARLAEMKELERQKERMARRHERELNERVRCIIRAHSISIFINVQNDLKELISHFHSPIFVAKIWAQQLLINQRQELSKIEEEKRKKEQSEIEFVSQFFF